jgi:hypothetical protein
MIHHKRLVTSYELGEVDLCLRLILWSVEEKAEDLGYGLRVTSIKRNDGRIHSLDRALDLTFFALPGWEPRISATEVGPFLERWVNARFIYGKGSDGRPRNVAWWHDAGSGLHLHIQIPASRLVVRSKEDLPRWTKSFVLELGG